MLALAGLETLLVLSWTILGASLLALLWSGWYLALPVFYFVALSLTAAVEYNSRQSPATALGVTIHGERTYGVKLLRIGLTPPLLLLGMVGYLRCFKGGLSLPEAISGADFRELDLQLDPRPRAIVMAGRKVAKRWVTAYTASAILGSAVVFFLANPLVIDVNTADNPSQFSRMSESDRELLVTYLELTALHPDELEYHVRLASLYHRNNMNSDLQVQLDEIRRLNPEHALLVLGDTSSVTLDSLLVAREDSLLPDTLMLPVDPDSSQALQDSTAGQSPGAAGQTGAVQMPAGSVEPAPGHAEPASPIDDEPQSVQPDSL